MPDPLLWVTSSACLFVFCSFYFVRTIILLRRPSLRRRGVLVEWVKPVYFVCLALAIALQVMNVAGVVVARGPAPFIGGLMFVLIPAGLMFAILVLTPLSSADL